MAGSNAICLETLTTIIAEENNDKIKPIKSSPIAKKIRSEFRNIVDKYKDEIKDGYEILLSKIGNINQPTNRDKLIKPFEILKI